MSLTPEMVLDFTEAAPRMSRPRRLTGGEQGIFHSFCVATARGRELGWSGKQQQKGVGLS